MLGRYAHAPFFPFTSVGRFTIARFQQRRVGQATTPVVVEGERFKQQRVFAGLISSAQNVGLPFVPCGRCSVCGQCKGVF